MQILPPAMPVYVTFATEELPWWSHWDFWVSFFTFALAVMTGWLALETRGLREDSKGTGEAAQKSAESRTGKRCSRAAEHRAGRQAFHRLESPMGHRRAVGDTSARAEYTAIQHRYEHGERRHHSGNPSSLGTMGRHLGPIA